MSALQSIPVHKLPGYDKAPRVWKRNGVGASVRIVDPDWVRIHTARAVQQEAEAQPHAAIEQWFKDAQWAGIVAPEGVVKPKRITMAGILKRFVGVYGFTLDDIKGSRKTRRLVRVRQAAAYWMRRRTGKPHGQIAALLGGRDHSTIVHAVQTHQSRRKSGDVPYNRKVTALQKETLRWLSDLHEANPTETNGFLVDGARNHGEMCNRTLGPAGLVKVVRIHRSQYRYSLTNAGRIALNARFV